MKIRAKFVGTISAFALCPPAIANDGVANEPLQQRADSEAPAPASQQREDIVVTGDRLSTYVSDQSSVALKADIPLIETPAAVTVITSELLADLNVINVADALRLSASIQTDRFGNRNGESGADIVIRGFLNPVTLRDGLRGVGGGGLQTIDRIEVLKGPASILFGQVSPGGVVNFVRKRPTDTFLLNASAEVGSFDFFRATLDAGAPLTETVSGRFNASYTDRGSFVDFNFNRALFLDLSLTWRPSDRTSVSLLVSYQYEEDRPQRGIPLQGTILPNPNGRIPISFNPQNPEFDTTTREGLSIFGEIAHQFSDKAGFKLLGTRDRFTGGLRLANIGTLDATQRILSFFPGVDQNFDLESYAFDVQFNFKFDTGIVDHNVLIGADYRRGTELFDTVNTAILPPVDVFNPVRGQPIFTGDRGFSFNALQDAYGVYVQDQIKLGELVLLSGARYDWIDQGSRNFNPVNTPPFSSQQDEALTGRVGALYHFPNGFAPFVSYSESFTANGGRDVTGRQFDPQNGRQVEAGVKYESSDKSFSATVSAYRIVLGNIATPDPVNIGFSVLTGEQTHQGIEFDVTGRLTDRLDVFISYAYIDAIISQSNRLIGGQPVEGERVTFQPSHSASAAVSYRPTDSLRLTAAATYRDRNPLSDFGEVFAPAYLIADLAAAYRIGDLDFGVNVKNVFDKTHFIGGLFFPTTQRAIPGAPRQVLATMRYAFGVRR